MAIGNLFAWIGSIVLLHTTAGMVKVPHRLRQSITPFPRSSSLSLTSSESSHSKASETELPNDFQDAVQRCAQRTVDCISSGTMRCRIDFDTTVGDMTYTSIKNSTPLLKELLKCLSITMNLSVPSAPKAATAGDTDEGVEPVANVSLREAELKLLNSQSIESFTIERSVRVFYPDMGAAALTRRDWKMGTILSEVPPCVFTANIQNDGLAETDKVAIILCPQYSEVDYVRRVTDLCTEQNVPCIMINPALINMDQGFGVRARNIRKNLLETFTTTYKLKTLDKGAVVREWPRGFTLWFEDASKEEGYVSLKTFSTDPTREEIEDLFDMMDPELAAQAEKNSAVSNAVGEVVGFFKGLSRL